MGFEQATIAVVREREFGELKAAIERAVAGEPTKFLRALSGSRVQVRNLEAAFAANAIDKAAGCEPGTSGKLYESLPVSDQAQVREFYLSKIEEIDSTLRVKFHKLFQYS